jgi:hypothetical protein
MEQEGGCACGAASLLSPGRGAALLVMARDFADKSAARQWVWDRLVLRA